MVGTSRVARVAEFLGMAVKSGMTVVLDKVAEVAGAIRFLGETRVMVGVPETKDERRDEKQPIGNAALAYIHSNGEPAANIPAREFLIPGLKNSQPQITDGLKNAGRLALDGKREAAKRQLVAVGLIGVNAVRAKLQEGIPPPLKPATIAARRRRSKGSTYRRKAQSATETTPLIDTAQLRNAIATVLRENVRK